MQKQIRNSQNQSKPSTLHLHTSRTDPIDAKKGCSPDSATCEGLFGRIRNEMFYNRTWEGVRIDEFISILDEYIVWYNTKRIKLSLGGLSPLEYRRKLGYTM